MWQSFRDTALELVGSKKFLVFVATLITMAAAKIGWNVDQDALDRILAIGSAYLLGQGIADHGKSAAVVVANDNALARATAASGGAPPAPAQAAA